jgi:hypothetical protein
MPPRQSARATQAIPGDAGSVALLLQSVSLLSLDSSSFYLPLGKVCPRYLHFHLSSVAPCRAALLIDSHRLYSQLTVFRAAEPDRCCHCATASQFLFRLKGGKILLLLQSLEWQSKLSVCVRRGSYKPV